MDVWSIGVIMYTVLVGKPPFETSDIKATYKRIKSNQYSFPDTVPVSDDARDLIESILQVHILSAVVIVLCGPYNANRHVRACRCAHPTDVLPWTTLQSVRPCAD